jgi:uncharacterized protein (TIGR00288 family)
MNNQEHLIAVLIDGDNANPKKLSETLAQISQFGTIKMKRVYGDFSQQNLNVWKDFVNRFSIKPVQAFSYTKGKNSTDMALAIDAMDILHEGKVNAFCIVSSDCDFTGLIHRIKEQGMFTIGVGQEKTCASFRMACDEFILEETGTKVVKEIMVKPILSEKKESVFRVPTEKLKGLKILGKINL